MIINPGKETLFRISESLKPFIHRTPVLRSHSLDTLTGCELFFKCENFQKTGSFKIRGALNALLSLDKAGAKSGVITHSSGNFAQALAYAAAKKGISAKIVMPQNVIPQKRDAVLSYGAEIVYSGNNPDDRETLCSELTGKTGAVFIHPSNNPDVILGHSSCAVETVMDTEDLDAVFCPVGGGGLVSGIAIGLNEFSPASMLFGGEPEGADDAYRSLKAGKIIPQTNPVTIADGLKTSLGSNTFPLIKKYVKEIVRVSETEIIYAMKLIWERLKITAEPSGAVSFAAFLQKKAVHKSKKIGIIVSGGNTDTSSLPFLIS